MRPRSVSGRSRSSSSLVASPCWTRYSHITSPPHPVQREESRAVRRYLEALEANRPKRGRKGTTESIQTRPAAIEDALEDADNLTGLKLIQERMDLHSELAFMEAREDLSEVEAEFVQVAANYSDRRGISYAAWREIGVEPAVLKRAGISRAS